MTTPSHIEIIEWADHTVSALLEHMGVDHGCRYILVSEQLLNCPDIGSTLEKVGGKPMTENVGADSFADPGMLDGCPDRLVDDADIDMMPPSQAAPWID